MIQLSLGKVFIGFLYMSMSSGFLFDTSTQAPQGSGLTDKHYYDLLDMIMEERRGRRQIEQYITGPLQIELKNVKNETEELTTTYQALLTDNANLKSKLAQLENTTGSKLQIDQLELQINSSFDNHDKQLHDLKTYLDNVSSNFSAVQSGMDIKMANIVQQISESSEMVALQMCGGYPIRKQTDYGAIRHWMGFRDVKASYGVSNLSSLQTSGIFYCEKPGLYLIIASIMCTNSNSKFQIILYTANHKANLLSQVQIVPRYSKPGSDVTMYHSGTGSAVVHLNFNDTLYIEPRDVRSTITDYNCLTIIKLK